MVRDVLTGGAVQQRPTAVQIVRNARPEVVPPSSEPTVEMAANVIRYAGALGTVARLGFVHDQLLAAYRAGQQDSASS